MTKSDLITVLKSEHDITKLEAEAIVNLVFDDMSKALSNGERIEIRGFCTMHVKNYDGYTGRNPKTGEPRYVKPKKLPFFKCGTELNNRINTKLRI